MVFRKDVPLIAAMSPVLQRTGTDHAANRRGDVSAEPRLRSVDPAGGIVANRWLPSHRPCL